MQHLRNIRYSLKHYKLNSLFVQNFFIILLVVMIPLNLISFFFYTSRNKSIHQEIAQSNDNLAYTVHSMIDSMLSEVRILAINTAAKDDVMSYLLNEPKPNVENASQASLIEYTKNFTYMHKYLQSIYIYCDRTDTILADYKTDKLENFADDGWTEAYRSIEKDETKLLLRAKNNYYPYYVTLIQPVFATDVDRLGAVIININIQELEKTFQQLNSPVSQKIYIVDGENRIVYSAIQNEILRSAEEIPILSAIQNAKNTKKQTVYEGGSTYIYAETPSGIFDWTYYSIQPMDAYHDRLGNTTALLLTLIAASVIIGAVASFYISFRTFTPIGNILDLISTPERWAESRWPDAPPNETIYILKQIGSTLKANRQLEDELNARLMLLKHAQIVGLQSQINPHFLYNTLDTINWMAVADCHGENRISDALTSLADLFKTNIDTTNYLTTLAEELAYTRQYIKILKLRYENLFDVVWHVDESLEAAKVPRLTLQPLIENALYHGIKPQKKKGQIQIDIAGYNHSLSLRVTDNGIGIKKEELEALQADLKKPYHETKTHIGLFNINQRIKLIYGETYGLRIESSANGTSVLLEMEWVE